MKASLQKREAPPESNAHLMDQYLWEQHLELHLIFQIQWPNVTHAASHGNISHSYRQIGQYLNNRFPRFILLRPCKGYLVDTYKVYRTSVHDLDTVLGIYFPILLTSFFKQWMLISHWCDDFDKVERSTYWTVTSEWYSTFLKSAVKGLHIAWYRHCRA